MALAHTQDLEDIGDGAVYAKMGINSPGKPVSRFYATQDTDFGPSPRIVFQPSEKSSNTYATQDSRISVSRPRYSGDILLSIPVKGGYSSQTKTIYLLGGGGVPCTLCYVTNADVWKRECLVDKKMYGKENVAKSKKNAHCRNRTSALLIARCCVQVKRLTTWPSEPIDDEVHLALVCYHVSQSPRVYSQRRRPMIHIDRECVCLSLIQW